MPARAPHPVGLVAVLVLASAVAACASPAAQPTATPSSSETDAPTPEPESDEPSASATESAEESAPDGDVLDMTLPSNFGSTDLTAGFQPDPFSADLVSGGPIDASYLGDGCRGYATSASDYDVTYTAGDQDLLRFYFVAEEVDDTTLIINAPDGSWHCNDDAPDTIDPMIDFANPESGRYDIWIGSFESGTEAAGTLYVTELESNAP